MTTVATLAHIRKYVSAGFLGKKTRLVDDINLSVNERTVHAIVGHNGAGKSTSFRVLVGATRPDAGSVSLFGAPPHRTARKRLGYASDVPALPATLTPVEVLRLHAALKQVAWSEKEGLALLERLGLAYAASRQLRTFSKGMLQRTNLAQALLGAPDFVVLDEPMSGLDPAGRDDMRRVIADERARGATVVIATHVLADVETLCDDFTVLREGRTVFAGSVASALASGRRGSMLTLAHNAGAQLPPTWQASATRHGDQVKVAVAKDDDLGAAIVALQAAGFRLVAVEDDHQPLEELVATLTRTEQPR